MQKEQKTKHKTQNMQKNKQKNIEFKNTRALAHQHSKTLAEDLLRLPFGGFQFRTFTEGSRTGYDVFFTGRAGEGLFLLVHHPLPSHVIPCFQNHLPHLQNGSYVQTFRFVSFYVFLDYLFCFYFIHGFFRCCGCGVDEMTQISLQE